MLEEMKSFRSPLCLSGCYLFFDHQPQFVCRPGLTSRAEHPHMKTSYSCSHTAFNKFSMCWFCMKHSVTSTGILKNLGMYGHHVVAYQICMICISNWSHEMAKPAKYIPD